MKGTRASEDLEASRQSLLLGLAPQSIAVVGASDHDHAPGGRTLRYLRRSGYQGRVFPINPKRTEVRGWQAYSGLDQLDVVPDLVSVVVNSQQVLETVRTCVKLGVPLVCVEAAGFAEAGPDGARLQDELAGVIQGSDTHVVGPNCLGLMRPQASLFSTITAVIETAWPSAGSIGVVSQSGAVGCSILSDLVRVGLGVSHWVTTGNELDIDIGDVTNYYSSIDEIDTVLVYLEEVRNKEKFQLGLERLRSSGKQAVVLNGGKSAVGGKAAASHTAALGTNSRFLAAMLEAVGARQVDSIRQMTDVAVLSHYGVTPSRRIAIVSSSGGHGVITADAAVASGLEVPALDAETARGLRDLIPLCSGANPLDATGRSAEDLNLLAGALRIISAVSDIDIIVLLLNHLGYVPSYTERLFPLLASVRESIECPIIAVTRRGEGASGIPESRIPIVEEPEDVMAALVAMAPMTMSAPAKPSVSTESVSVFDALPEWEALDRMHRAGLDVVRSHYLTSPAELDQWAADADAGTYVVKLMASGNTHKTERGWIRTGLSVTDAVAVAHGFLDEANSLPPQAWRIAIQPEVTDKVAELLVGLTRDDKFGWQLLIGTGGQLAELIDDVQCLRVPADRNGVLAALERLRIWRVLNGWRGRPAGAVDAVLSAVEALQRMAVASTGATNIEVNPFVVTQAKAVAVDAVVVMGS